MMRLSGRLCRRRRCTLRCRGRSACAAATRHDGKAARYAGKSSGRQGLTKCGALSQTPPTPPGHRTFGEIAKVKKFKAVPGVPGEKAQGALEGLGGSPPAILGSRGLLGLPQAFPWTPWSCLKPP